MFDIGRSHATGWAVALLLPACTFSALAADESSATSTEAEQKAAFTAAGKVLVRGPSELPFGSQTRLQLPAGFVFVPTAEASRLMKSMGNSVDSGFQGMIVPRSNDGSWSFFVVSYHSAGYVKDDDAKNWDAAKMLDQIREGTSDGNKRRAQMGIDEIEITGWIQPPKYDPATHQVVWSVGLRHKGAAASPEDGINYKTLVLGREGYMSMNLITDQAHIDELRPSVATLLNGLSFNDGKRYADFNSSTDRVAEFGLAALIAGVAAKKLGLLALMAAFVVKFAKVIIVAAAGLLLALRKRLGLKKGPPAAPPPQVATAAQTPAPPSATSTDTA